MSRTKIERVSSRMKSGTTLTSATNVTFSGSGSLSATNVSAAVTELETAVASATGSVGAHVNYLTVATGAVAVDTVNFVVKLWNASSTVITTSTGKVLMELYDADMARPIVSPRAASSATPLLKVDSISVGTGLAGGPPTTNMETFLFHLSGGIASINIVVAATSSLLTATQFYAKFTPVTTEALGAQTQSHPVVITWTFD
jgi:hypothetical protein